MFQKIPIHEKGTIMTESTASDAREDNNSAEHLCDLASEQFEKGEVQESWKLLDKALAVDPACRRAYMKRYRIAMAKYRYDKALPEINQVMRLCSEKERFNRDLHPNSNTLYELRALAYIGVGLDEEAISDLTKVIEHEGGSIGYTYELRGIAHSMAGNYAAAEADLREGLDMEWPAVHADDLSLAEVVERALPWEDLLFDKEIFQIVVRACSALARSTTKGTPSGEEPGQDTAPRLREGITPDSNSRESRRTSVRRHAVASPTCPASAASPCPEM